MIFFDHIPMCWLWGIFKVQIKSLISRGKKGHDGEKWKFNAVFLNNGAMIAISKK